MRRNELGLYEMAGKIGVRRDRGRRALVYFGFETNGQNVVITPLDLRRQEGNSLKCLKPVRTSYSEVRTAGRTLIFGSHFSRSA